MSSYHVVIQGSLNDPFRGESNLIQNECDTFEVFPV